jgi:hypothetical protein
MANADLVNQIKQTLNDGNVTVTDELINAIAELWPLAPNFARIIEREVKMSIDQIYDQAYKDGHTDGYQGGKDD